jgi:hypothetical protein
MRPVKPAPELRRSGMAPVLPREDRYADGSANTIRPTSLVYPDGRTIVYNYGGWVAWSRRGHHAYIAKQGKHGERSIGMPTLLMRRGHGTRL